MLLDQLVVVWYSYANFGGTTVHVHSESVPETWSFIALPLARVTPNLPQRASPRYLPSSPSAFEPPRGIRFASRVFACMD